MNRHDYKPGMTAFAAMQEAYHVLYCSLYQRYLKNSMLSQPFNSNERLLDVSSAHRFITWTDDYKTGMTAWLPCKEPITCYTAHFTNVTSRIACRVNLGCRSV